MPMRSLKMRPDLPRDLESRLQNKWGFKLQTVVLSDKCTVFYKSYISDKVKADDKQVIAPLVKTNVHIFANKALTAYEQAALERRCDNIVAFFNDPYNHIVPVRTRLHNMSQTLTEPERQYVLEYMDDNFPLEDKGK